MTVKQIDLPDRVFCQWFAGAKLSSGWFSPETLILTQEEPGAPPKA